MKLPAWLSRLRVRLRFDLPSPIDWLSPCAIEADDRFIAPLSASEIEEARQQEIASLKILAGRARAAYPRLVEPSR